MDWPFVGCELIAVHQHSIENRFFLSAQVWQDDVPFVFWIGLSELGKKATSPLRSSPLSDLEKCALNTQH